jgi:hypothetical protein
MNRQKTGGQAARSRLCSLISECYYDELTESDRRALGKHLLRCENCREYLRGSRRLADVALKSMELIADQLIQEGLAAPIQRLREIFQDVPLDVYILVMADMGLVEIGNQEGPQKRVYLTEAGWNFSGDMGAK